MMSVMIAVKQAAPVVPAILAAPVLAAAVAHGTRATSVFLFG